MYEMILAAFSTIEKADKAVDELQQAGFKTEDISVIVRQTRSTKKEGQTSSAADLYSYDITGGAVIGGVLGLLTGALGIIVIGPIAALLGLVGIAGTTVTGAVLGAVTGGIVAALENLGVPRQKAKQYEEYIQAGGVLLAVPIESRDENEVADIFKRNGAEDVIRIDAEPEKRSSNE